MIRLLQNPVMDFTLDFSNVMYKENCVNSPLNASIQIMVYLNSDKFNILYISSAPTVPMQQ